MRIVLKLLIPYHTHIEQVRSEKSHLFIFALYMKINFLNLPFIVIHRIGLLDEMLQKFFSHNLF